MNVRLLSVFFFVALVAIFVQPARAFEVKGRVYVTVSNGNAHTVDSMGVAIGATDCLDASLGESELPPAPPSGIFDARFVEAGCADLQGLSLDYHGGSALNDTAGNIFELKVQKDTTTPVWLSFNSGWTYQMDSLEITDYATGGSLFNVNMLAGGNERDTVTMAYISHNATHDVLDIQIQWKWRAMNPLGVAVKNNNLVPKHFALTQNFPNPFNPTTTIEFAIEKTAMTDVAVYNILGQKVATLVGQQLTPGNYSARWNGTDDHGTQVASGVYFVRMNARSANGATTFNQIRKLVLMK